MKSGSILLAVCCACVLGPVAYAQNNTEVLSPSSQSTIDVRLALRELWQYQVTWMRSYIVSALSGLDDVTSVERKLVQNQEQIGNAVKPYYGSMAGDRLAVLLRCCRICWPRGSCSNFLSSLRSRTNPGEEVSAMAKKSRGGRMTAAKRRAAKKSGGRGQVKNRRAGRNIMAT